MKYKINFIKLTIAFLLFLVYVCKVEAKDIVSQIMERGYITLATNAEFAPFEYKDGENIVGIDIDIAKKIAERMDVQLRITDVSFDALPLELSGKTCDFVMAGMSYSEDKAQNADFSMPYFNAKQAVIVPRDSEINSGESLREKKIGVHMGTTGDIYCTENFKDSEIIRYGKGTEAILDMVHGRIDAVVIDDLPAKMLTEKNKGNIRILDEYLFEEQYRVVIPKGNEELLSVINVILRELQDDGVVEEIISTHSIDSSDFGQGISGLIYSGLVYKNRYKNIIGGLFNTLKITCGALIIGVAIGSIIAIINLSASKRIVMKTFKGLANLYLLVIRGTPVVVQLFVIYYLIFVSTDISKITVAMIAFGINSGAYLGVVLQSGILSVDRGQYEAARSLGLSSRKAMMKVVIPQALKNVVATLCNEFIDLIKETSVSGFIGIMDLSRAGDIIRTQTLDPVVPLLTVAIVYLLIIMLISSLMSLIERRLRRSDLR